MLPAFHGERMEALTGLLEELTEREVASWPLDEPVALHPRLQGLTMEVILRAVFGLDPGSRLETIRKGLTKNLELGATPPPWCRSSSAAGSGRSSSAAAPRPTS